MTKTIAVSIFTLLVLSALGYCGENAGYKVAVHVVPMGAGASCGGLPVINDCSDITTTHASCELVYAFPVFYGLTGITAAEHGLTWPSAWGPCLGYTGCADIPVGNIVNPGDGMQYGWAACQTGYAKVLGYGLFSAMSPGQIEIVPHPSSGMVQVFDCSSDGDEPSDNFAAGVCGTSGEDPCGPGFLPLDLAKDDGLTGCAEPGSLITYTIDYENPNTLSVNNVVLVDNIPIETSFQSATGGGLYFAPTNQVVWSIGGLGPSEGGSQQVTVWLDIAATRGISLVDTAAVWSDETDTTEVTLSTLVCVSPVEITNLDDGVPDCVEPGDTITYTIQLMNPNSIEVYNVELFSHPPLETDFVSADPGGTYYPADNEVRCWLGSLNPGMGVFVYLKVEVRAGTERAITLVDTCWTDGHECSPSQPETESTLVCPLTPLDIVVTPSVDSCAVRGRNMAYNMVCTNPNVGPVTLVTVSNSLPDSAVFRSASDGGSYEGLAHEVTWEIGTLAAGEAESLQVVVCPLARLDPGLILADTCWAVCTGADTSFAVASTELCSTGVWFVATTGSDESGDGSRVNPLRTLDCAVTEHMKNTDSLIVLPGVYDEWWTFPDYSLTIVSDSGPDATHLTGHWAILFTGQDCTVEGFTISSAGLDSIMVIYAEGDVSFTIKSCVFTACCASEVVRSIMPVEIVNSTFFGNTTVYTDGVLCANGPDPYELQNCIFAFNTGGPPVRDGCTATCCDVYGNEYGDYVAGLTGQEGVRNNFSADPIFCDTLSGDLRLRVDSPCAPWAGSPCGLVGALGIGCGCASSITGIEDVGNDQGRQVRLVWSSSPCDVPGSLVPITGYAVYRRQDAFLLGSSVGRDTDWLPADPVVFGGASGWDYLMTVPALGDASYQCVAPTLCDSTAGGGICWSVFKVIALTADPLTHFESPPDSGYSTDNLAPSAPSNFRMTSAIELAWDESGAADFDYFSVYGSDSPVFDLSAVLIEHTVGTTSDVTGHVYDYYHVRATDFAGNPGNASSVANSYAGIPSLDKPPAGYALRQNQPNPFEASTLVRFDMPEAGPVSLEVVDVEGRLVKSLVSGMYAAGSHSALWRGDDEAGDPVKPGIYFLRLEAGDYRATRKMILLR